MRFTLQIIRRCVDLGVPVCLENPAASMMWQLPPLQKLASHVACRPYVTDFCQHGAAWRKRTLVMSWHCVHISYPPTRQALRGKTRTLFPHGKTSHHCCRQ
eukprot:1618062-Heterocapsa_arctica.AAC.1